MTLYNLKSEGDLYRITKFDDDLNPLSSYLVSESHCDCPAGHRPICRHREMLAPMRKRVDSAWFYNYTSQAWADPTGEAALQSELPIPSPRNPMRRI